MRCKVGDLAVITGGEPTSDIGRLVEVVVPSPLAYGNVGPDGNLYDGGPASWIVRSLGEPFVLWNTLGMRRIAEYGPVDDGHLRPIRPDPIPETVTDDIEVPA